MRITRNVQEAFKGGARQLSASTSSVPASGQLKPKALPFDQARRRSPRPPAASTETEALTGVPFDQKADALFQSTMLLLSGSNTDAAFNLSGNTPVHPLTRNRNDLKNPIDMSHLQQNSRTFLRDDDLTVWPKFLDIREQRVLLSSAMDAMEKVIGTSGQLRRKRKMWSAEKRIKEAKEIASGARATSWRPDATTTVDDLFMSEECYDFEEGHIDAVIQNYRESSVHQFVPTSPELPRIIRRLVALTATGKLWRPILQMHVLHLASNGFISPHIDSASNSGEEILGVSLGAPRIMRLSAPPPTRRDSAPTTASPDYIDVLLESGSVYLQKGMMRKSFNHEILLKGEFDGKVYEGGQRLSFMMRDLPQDELEEARQQTPTRQTPPHRRFTEDSEAVATEYTAAYAPFDYREAALIQASTNHRTELRTREEIEKMGSVHPPPRG